MGPEYQPPKLQQFGRRFLNPLPKLTPKVLFASALAMMSGSGESASDRGQNPGQTVAREFLRFQ